MKRFQISLRTVAITVTVFCCLLGMFPIDVDSRHNLAGLWVGSPRCFPPSEPMVGFIWQRYRPTHDVYYACLYCYDETSVPAAIIYESETIGAVQQGGFSVQTLNRPLTPGWTLVVMLVFLAIAWFPIHICITEGVRHES